MRALSPLDGSADAIRQAAESAESAKRPEDDHRLSLERELDRLNLAIHGAAAAVGQHLNSLLMSQSMLLLAYLVVLIVAWSIPLPGKHWLMGGIAAMGLLSVVLPYLGLRGARDRIGPLKQQRKGIEEALERVAARPPVFARQGGFSALLAQVATRGLPVAMVAGWFALSIYTLALPTSTDTRSTVQAPASSAEKRAPAVASKSPRPVPGKSVAAAPTDPSVSAAPVAVESTAEAGDSPLLNFFRRAINQPAPEPVERVGP
ncbi:MAG: hypothetical protein ACREBN_12865 [Burkholderiaceae bacterium]